MVWAGGSSGCRLYGGTRSAAADGFGMRLRCGADAGGNGAGKRGDLRQLFGRLNALAGLQEGYLQPLLKAMGISFAAELAAQVCTDLGENGLAVKVGLMGRLCVFALTAPLMMSILEMILELVP